MQNICKDCKYYLSLDVFKVVLQKMQIEEFMLYFP